MSVTGLCTSGWLDEYVSKTIFVIEATEPLTGTLDVVVPIVGSIEEQDQIIGVLSCDGDEMTDIEIVRGDSRNLQIAIYESDGVTPIDLTNSVIRFAVKERASQPNSEAKVWKSTYNSDEIFIVNPLTGTAVVYLLVDDTLTMNPGRYQWEVELNRQGPLATSTGTLTFTAGSDTAAAVGVDFSELRVGQIVIPNGLQAGNSEPMILTAFDEAASTMTFYKYGGFSSESGVTFSAYQGDRKTPSGLRGAFIVCADVVR